MLLGRHSPLEGALGVKVKSLSALAQALLSLNNAMMFDAPSIERGAVLAAEHPKGRCEDTASNVTRGQLARPSSLTFAGCVAVCISCNFRIDTCVYICVADRFACPSIAWIYRISAPFSSM